MSLKDTIAQKIAQKARDDEAERARSKQEADASQKRIQESAKAALLYWLSDDVIEALIDVHMNYPRGGPRKGYFVIKDGGADLVTVRGKGSWGLVTDRTNQEYSDLKAKGVSSSFLRSAFEETEVLDRIKLLGSEGISIEVGQTDNHSSMISIDYSRVV